MDSDYKNNREKNQLYFIYNQITEKLLNSTF